jgi:adenylate cyclase
MKDVQRIVDWLVDGAPGAPTPVALLERLCPDLVAAGLPLDRVESFVRTLHPHVVGRSFRWSPGGPVEAREQSWAYLRSPDFLGTPVAEVFRTGAEWRGRRRTGEDGFTDFFAGPLHFLSGEVHAITFATRAPGGFTDEHLGAIRAVLRPLSRIAEIFALRRTAVNLLSTYVGRDAGERILAGHVQRGDAESLLAVLWWSDLRGFTLLSREHPPAEVLRTLNDLFDCQVPAIERHGGEVLKFIGDGLLAIFPLGGERSHRATCDAALAAAGEALAALAPLNRERAADGRPLIRVGLALHLGEVAYGNIGGVHRLDFTCIGPAVNLAARLESLTAQLQRPVVLSAEVARVTSYRVERLGTFDLKGVAEPTEVFAPTGLGSSAGS